MKKLKIKYKNGSYCNISNSRKDYPDIRFQKYLDTYARHVEDVESAILYYYPIKNNEPLVLIQDGVEINKLK